MTSSVIMADGTMIAVKTAASADLAEASSRGASVVTFMAKVVHRIEEGDSTGMGVAFASPDEVVSSLSPLVAGFQGDS